jgi:hypothetical protein
MILKHVKPFWASLLEPRTVAVALKEQQLKTPQQDGDGKQCLFTSMLSTIPEHDVKVTIINSNSSQYFSHCIYLRQYTNSRNASLINSKPNTIIRKYRKACELLYHVASFMPGVIWLSLWLRRPLVLLATLLWLGVSTDSGYRMYAVEKIQEHSVESNILE